MADNKFFNKFPLIRYNGATCVNITERVALRQSVFMNAYLYYPYDIQSEERADQFANRYYGDSFESWLVYLANQIYDPLREWYHPSNVFNDVVTEKYGSLQAAISKTKFYRNNWMNGEDITPSRYDSLIPLLRGYYEPKTTGYRITGYKRRNIDWTLNTNRIVAYNVSNTSFVKDEIVDIVFNANNLGQGQVLSVDVSSDTVYIQHVNGVYIESSSYLKNETDDYVLTEAADYVLVDGGSYLYGTESTTNSAFNTYSNGVFIPSKVVVENLDPSEDVFWAPVSYFDYETEGNEYNKTIRVLDTRYAPEVVKNLQNVLTV